MPDVLSGVGLDDIALVVPRLTTIVQPTELLAKEAVRRGLTAEDALIRGSWPFADRPLPRDGRREAPPKHPKPGSAGRERLAADCRPNVFQITDAASKLSYGEAADRPNSLLFQGVR
ncbi:hypothetical protein [Roseobacter sinensis]|uniref:Uncharacterized protein n=1 Tax=Roseobacter sinensis TaxID=2931391 RepID=A0ABT3BHI1_9RHOB|nr:hypothetical protein [Roseobacter sp. WL0113]MCV3272844.1 hypothetical protein [Roseobacter sp. WL0113]